MKKLRITVGKQTYDVTVEVLSDETTQQAVGATPQMAPQSAPISRPVTRSPESAPTTASGAVPAGAVTSPMAGVVKSTLVKAGDTVTKGQALIVLEAMKMDNHVIAPEAGTVQSVNVAEGDSVQEGHVLVELKQDRDNREIS